MMPTGRCAWPMLTAALGGAFALLTTAITWAEYATSNTTSLDLAVYSQLVWNTAHGQPFETSLLLENRLHLAEHLALLLLPLAPLYGLLPDLKLLLGLQQAALALSGGPLFWLARGRVGPGPAVLLLGAYYAMPTLAEVALDAFYPIAFAALPVGAAVALALAGHHRGAALLVLLALLLEEEAALLSLGLGLFFALFAPAARRHGLVLLLVGGLWLLLAEGVVMPRFHQPDSAGAETRAEGHFDGLRADPLGWLGNVAATRLEPELARALARPGAGAQRPTCAQPGQCSALRWWLYPTAGLALLSPRTVLIAAPPAAALLLADRPGRFRRHWAAPMLPVIWLATALGLVRLAARPRLGRLGLAALVVATLAMYRLDSPLPLGSQYEADDVRASPRGGDLARLTADIPSGASVGASRRGLARLANRPILYAYPPDDYAPGLWPPAELPTYLLLDLTNDATVRALRAPGGPLGAAPPYQEVARTPNALLLRRS